MAEDFEMSLLLWIFISLVALACGQDRPPCLTGTMTDVQSWVTETGELTDLVDLQTSLDLSARSSPRTLHQTLTSTIRSRKKTNIQYLSLARNSLSRIPTIFDELRDNDGLNLAQTVEYLSLYGNQFVEVSSPGEYYEELFNATGATEINTMPVHGAGIRAKWSAGFQRVFFTKLRELDLRACGISTIDSHVFQNVPELEALYLSDNSISVINSNAFNGIPKLMHLDLSRNNGLKNHEMPKHLTIQSNDEFTSLQHLRSLDLSYTKLNPRSVAALKSVGREFERLSLCYTGHYRLEPGFFSNTSIKTLDVSGNHMILNADNALSGIEDTLTVLYASEVGLRKLDVFANFSKLEILQLNNNEIAGFKCKTAGSLKSLQALDLRKNRFRNWSKSLFSQMPSLNFLDLRSNTINVLSQKMIRDLGNVSFLALSENPIVCNCHAKELLELAARNEKSLSKIFLAPMNYGSRKENRFLFHSGFARLNNMISSRRNITLLKTLDDEQIELKSDGNFVLIDYGTQTYLCLSLRDSKKVPFEGVRSCTTKMNIDGILDESRRRLFALLAIPGILLPILLAGYTYRRNLRYFYIMTRNSAVLSIVHENKINGDDAIYNYDVFVSYCNEDRPWVLDQLLSHLENDCSVSLCLHERDFQVGLSILENIVSCMDRSKSIMLVISKQFLRSQWCQFEMHLAQHRLLETRREDLILILLEDMPRRLRPNTLHYLMLTKTYIVWPKDKSEQQVFWKRLKKSVTTQRQRDNRVSFA